MATRRAPKTNNRDGNVRSSESSMPVMEDHWSDVPSSYLPSQVPSQNLQEIESYYAQGQATTPSNPYYGPGSNPPLSSGQGSQRQGRGGDEFGQPFTSAANSANIHVIDKELQKQFRGRTKRSANSKIHWMENKHSQIMGMCWTVGCLGMTLAFYNYRWAGLIAGSINTIVCGMAVVVTYNLKREWHQHPNPIVHLRSCLAIFLAICLLLNIIVDFDPSNQDSAASCRMLAGLTEFFFFASEAWGLMMAIDLYSSLNDPFKSYKRSMKFYHGFVWTSSLLMAVITFTQSDRDGPAGGFFQVDAHPINDNDSKYNLIGFCLASSGKSRSGGPPRGFVSIQKWPWILLYGIVVFVLVVSVIVLIIAWRRLYAGGVPKTYNIRLGVLNYISLFTGAMVFYWLFLLFMYMSTYFVAENNINQPLELFPMMMRQFFMFLVASKGYLEYIIWFAVNNTKKKTGTKSTDVDVDLSPQVNLALRSEILFYTTSGIKQSVQEAASGHSSSEMFLLTDGQDEKGKTIKFWSYAPTVFRTIRENYGIFDDEYIGLFSATTKERFSEGRSGAFMFYSADERIIVKTMSKEECELLRRMAPKYASYLVSHPQSLMTKFYGCHAVLLYGKMYYFVVMGNIFANTQVIHHRYDIKGSWEDRNARLPKVGNKVTCRYCNARYTFGSTKSQECGDGLNFHEPNIVLKDNDLLTKVRIDPQASNQLYDQLCFDSDFLYDQGIMDYSLLMGVQSCEYYVEPGIVGFNPNMHPGSTFATQTAISVNGPALYQFGIIDFLQQWTLEKKLERFWKQHIKRKDPDGISAIPPKQYKLRFQQKMSQVFAISKAMANNPFIGQPPILLDVFDQGLSSTRNNHNLIPENGSVLGYVEDNLRHTSAPVLSENERDATHLIPR